MKIQMSPLLNNDNITVESISQRKTQIADTKSDLLHNIQPQTDQNKLPVSLNTRYSRLENELDEKEEESSKFLFI